MSRGRTLLASLQSVERWLSRSSAGAASTAMLSWGLTPKS